jgi:hypothetical protein
MQLGLYKWEHTPTHRGFSSFYGYYSGGEDYYSHVCFGGGLDFRRDPSPNTTAATTQMEFCGPVEDGGLDCNDTESTDPATSAYSTFRYTAEARSRIATHDFDTKPLFLYLPFQVIKPPFLCIKVLFSTKTTFCLDRLRTNVRTKSEKRKRFIHAGRALSRSSTELLQRPVRFRAQAAVRN